MELSDDFFQAAGNVRKTKDEGEINTFIPQPCVRSICMIFLFPKYFF